MSIDTESDYSYNQIVGSTPVSPADDLLTVDRLSAASGIGVDTIRYYQRLGLLEAPVRRGRRAVYRDAHLDRLAEIRRLAEEGFSLAQIANLDKIGRASCRERV